MKLKDRWVEGWLTATSGVRFGVYAYTDTQKNKVIVHFGADTWLFDEVYEFSTWGKANAFMRECNVQIIAGRE